MSKIPLRLAWLKKFTVPILALLLAVAVGLLGYMYFEIKDLKQDPGQLAQNEVEDLLARVRELIVLPTDETPTVATVSDPELLKDQPFFAHAKTGDRVLLYAKAKKAILYDPEAHVIVEVAPINLGDNAAVQPEPEVAGQSDETGDIAE
jgi:hypothetical protein